MAQIARAMSLKVHTKQAWSAALQKDEEALVAALSFGASPSSRNLQGQTILHYVCSNGDEKLASCLLTYGGDKHVNLKTPDDFTPLHEAVWSGSLPCVQLLLQHSADPNLLNKQQESPLHQAIHLRSTELAIEIMNHPTTNIHLLSQDDRSPLYLACWYELTEIVPLLLEKGADPKIATKRGWTPLHWAARKSNLKIAELLIEAGASVTAPNNDGLTPLHEAAVGGSLQLIQLLCQQGAVVNIATKQGETPLEIACCESKHEAVLELLHNGADPNLVTPNGMFPIHWTTDEIILNMLLSFGADPLLKDKDGLTALQTAKKTKDVHLEKVLKRAEKYEKEERPSKGPPKLDFSGREFIAEFEKIEIFEEDEEESRKRHSYLHSPSPPPSPLKRMKSELSIDEFIELDVPTPTSPFTSPLRSPSPSRSSSRSSSSSSLIIRELTKPNCKQGGDLSQKSEPELQEMLAKKRVDIAKLEAALILAREEAEEIAHYLKRE